MALMAAAKISSIHQVIESWFFCQVFCDRIKPPLYGFLQWRNAYYTGMLAIWVHCEIDANDDSNYSKVRHDDAQTNSAINILSSLKIIVN